MRSMWWQIETRAWCKLVAAPEDVHHAEHEGVCGLKEDDERRWCTTVWREEWVKEAGDQWGGSKRRKRMVGMGG